MGKKKKIKKSIESFDKVIKEHEEKIKEYTGKNYALIDYWKKEIAQFKKFKEDQEGKLKKK